MMIKEINLSDISIKILPGTNSFFTVAYWQKIRVGGADCVFEGCYLLLGDIKVDDAVALPVSIFKPWTWSKRYRQTRINFRGRGVGRLILKKILAEAKMRGFKLIYGNLVQHDIERSPFLMTMYERAGFVVSEPDDDGVGIDAIKKVIRIL